jgi:hypothetical protein
VKKIPTITLLLLCLSTLDGFSSQVIPEYIALEQLVRNSSFIVVAEPARPSSVTKEISIGWFKPSYTLYVGRYVVREVLAGVERRIAEGKTIEVYPYQWTWKLAMHRDYHENGISSSPIIDSYRPGIQGDGQGEVILFLRTNADNELEFTVDRAYESPSKKDEIRRVLVVLSKGK